MGASAAKAVDHAAKLPGPLAVVWGGPGRRRLVALLLAAVGLIAAGQWAWRKWGEAAAHGRDFQVAPSRIEVTPQPDWIRAEVKTEALEQASIQMLNLRDPQLVERVQRAFSMHPWVAKVTSVRKRFPAQVTVELEYRRPVAMVEVVKAGGQPALVFLDADSVLLPDEDFRPPENLAEKDALLFSAQIAKRYLRIHSPAASPAGRMVGSPWGSEAIAGAAKLAGVWGDQWQSLGLYRILVAADQNALPLYELQTENQTHVVWGHAPGAETKDEPLARDKIVWLRQYVVQKGPLDKSAKGIELDLRQKDGKPPEHTAREGRKATR